MLRWLRSLFAWRAVKRVGVWILSENTVTGQRAATWRGGGYSPMPDDWLRKGDIVDGYRGRYVIGEESEIWNS